MNFTKLLGGYEFAPAGGISMASEIVPRVALTYSCNELGSEGDPFEIEQAACRYSNEAHEFNVILGDIEPDPGLIFWPSFVTVTGPTLADVSPAPDWVLVSIGWPEAIFFSYDGDPDTGAAACRAPIETLYRCGPRVEYQPEITVEVEGRDWRLYHDWSTEWAEDGTYDEGDLHYVDADAPTDLDADPLNAYQLPGVTPEESGYIVPPTDYAGFWTPPSGEAFPQNANKLWPWSDAAAMHVRWYAAAEGENKWSETQWQDTPPTVRATLYWEIESGAPGEIVAGAIGRGVRTRDRIAGRAVTP